MKTLLVTIAALLSLSTAPTFATPHEGEMRGVTHDEAAAALEPLRRKATVKQQRVHNRYHAQRQLQYCLGACSIALAAIALALMTRDQKCGAQAVCNYLRTALAMIIPVGTAGLLLACKQHTHHQ